MTMELTIRHLDILDHTLHRAPCGRFCGGSSEMSELVAAGLMQSIGRASWCPDEYFVITGAGREAFKVKAAQVK